MSLRLECENNPFLPIASVRLLFPCDLVCSVLFAADVQEQHSVCPGRHRHSSSQALALDPEELAMTQEQAGFSTCLFWRSCPVLQTPIAWIITRTRERHCKADYLGATAVFPRQAATQFQRDAQSSKGYVLWKDFKVPRRRMYKDSRHKIRHIFSTINMI